MRRRPYAVIALLASMMGFGFSAVSTYDSMAHLDRQVHGIHCSYFLGMGETDAAGSSGCYATLMSPYSSVLRESIWGGVPAALPGMSVFGFLAYWIVFMLVGGRFSIRPAGFLLAATALPLLTSIVMGYLSVVTLDTACKTCMGIYAASILAFGAAAMIFRAARQDGAAGPGEKASGGETTMSLRALAAAFALGVLFVAVPVGAYAALAPDYSRYAGACGSLAAPGGADEFLLPLGPQSGEVEMIEVTDPLCKACAMVERRLKPVLESLDVRRRLLLFPLDNTCNWMVDEAVHPGACAVSEAMLCAKERADEVLDWAMENQDEIIERAKRDPEAAARMVKSRFPKLSTCVGSSSVKAKLNLALRWAVKNQLQVLTPQIFVDGLRLCDEDTDLGLEFALSRLVERAEVSPAAPAAPAEEVRPPAPRRADRARQIRTAPAAARTEAAPSAPTGGTGKGMDTDKAAGNKSPTEPSVPSPAPSEEKPVEEEPEEEPSEEKVDSPPPEDPAPAASDAPARAPAAPEGEVSL